MRLMMPQNVEISPVGVGLAEHVKAEAGGANVTRYRVPLRRQQQSIESAKQEKLCNETLLGGE